MHAIIGQEICDLEKAISLIRPATPLTSFGINCVRESLNEEIIVTRNEIYYPIALAGSILELFL